MARFGEINAQYFDDAGAPLGSGKLYFYESGTTTPKNTYADINLTIPNTNPVILTAAGRQPNIFFNGNAKGILTDKNDVQILVRDPIGETGTNFGDAWVATTIYSANSVVIGSDGVYYRSLANGNQNNNPTTTSGFWTLLYSVEWNAGITYDIGAVVTYDNQQYQSLQTSNLNNNPASATSYWVPLNFAWVATATYSEDQNVVGTDGILYTSLQNSNTGNDPATSPAYWVGTSAAAAASAVAAAASAAAALVSENAAAADAVATAADVVQTGLDAAATAADAIATAADRVQTGLDAAATAADVILTNADAVATAADRVQTGLDAAATSADAIATAADRVQTGLDVIATNADASSTAADAIATAADVVQTGLDVVATSADVVQTGLDVTAAAGSASAASGSASAAAASAAAAASSYDAFDDRYLGDKASDPTVDNDGNALLTGALYFNTTSDVMKVYDGSAWNIAAISSASPTFTGTVTADGLVVNGDAVFSNGDSTVITGDDFSKLQLKSLDSSTSSTGVMSEIADVALVDFNGGSNNHKLVIRTNDGLAATGTLRDRIEIKADGDISFYEDTGTTPKFFWDASAESLGIGTTSPSVKISSVIDTSTEWSSSANLSNATNIPIYAALFENNDTSITGSEVNVLFTAGGSGSGQHSIGVKRTGANIGDLIFRRRSDSAASRETMRIVSNGDIAFYNTNGTSQSFYWDASTEYLGIGTTSPVNALDIAGSNTGQYIRADVSSNFDGDATNKHTVLYISSSNTPDSIAALSLQARNTSNVWRNASMALDNSALTFLIPTATNTAPTTSDERLRITASGNVGIGTSSPDNKLDLLHSANALDGITIRSNNSGSSAGAQMILNGYGNSWGIACGSTAKNSNSLTFSIDALGSNTERMRIDSSGNVGIGTDDPSNLSGATNLLIVKRTDTSNNYPVVYSASAGNAGWRMKNNNGDWVIIANDALRFYDIGNAAERMRIDSSGNLLVGKTSQTIDTVGAELLGSVGKVQATRDGGASGGFNRKTSDGNIVEFYKDGSVVGSIGTYAGDVYIGTGDAGLWFQDGGNAIRPFRVDTVAGHDASIDLGHTANRFKDAHFSGTVNANAFVGDGSGLTGVGGGGAWELVSSITASNSSYLTFTGLGSTYLQYMFVFENLKMGSSSRKFLFEVSDNNGSSYINTSVFYDSKGIIGQTSTPSGSRNETSTGMYLTTQDLPASSSGYIGLSGQMNLFTAGGSNSQIAFTAHLAYSNTGGSPLNQLTGGATLGNASAINALRFFSENSGTVASGKIYLYGLKRT